MIRKPKKNNLNQDNNNLKKKKKVTSSNYMTNPTYTKSMINCFPDLNQINGKTSEFYMGSGL